MSQIIDSVSQAIDTTSPQNFIMGLPRQHVVFC